jgi:hypothetical protein
MPRNYYLGWFEVREDTDLADQFGSLEYKKAGNPAFF